MRTALIMAIGFIAATLAGCYSKPKTRTAQSAIFLPAWTLTFSSTANVEIVCEGQRFDSASEISRTVAADCWAEIVRMEREEKEAECKAARKSDIYATCDSDKWDANRI